MKILIPSAITNDRLISSSVAEDDAALWNPDITYVVGERVMRLTTHRVYEALVAGAESTPPELAPLRWLDLGPTNRWAMFDGQVGSMTSAPQQITVTIAPGAISGLALLEIEGTGYSVTMHDGIDGSVVYERTGSLDITSIGDWLVYFTADFSFRSELTLTDLPVSFGGQSTISITGPGAVSVGSLIVGSVQQLGGTEMGATLGIRDYSRKTTDEFGRTSVAVRAYAKRLNARVVLQPINLPGVYRTLAQVRATPCVWIASDDARLDTLSVYGWAKDFQIDVAYRDLHYCSLEIEGLI